MTRARHPHRISLRRILEHALFWVLHWAVMTLYGGLYDLDFITPGLYNLTSLPLIILFTYLFVYAIFPLFFQRKWLAFAVVSLFAFALAILLRRLSLQYIQFPWLYAGSEYTFMFFGWYQMMGHFVQLIVTVGIVAGLKYFRDWLRAKDRVEALSAEKRAAELSFLKAQVHPHFLFNTLNSIYYEVLRKSDTAPDLIIRLSDMLRFTLYECKDPWIPVAKEVKLIRDYIALEQHRYGDRLSVDFTVTGETDGPMVPPLVCFSLVENAFKHGTSENKGHSHIAIALAVGEGRLRLEVENPIAVSYQPDVLGASKGIGMRNITRQLDLLFEERYTLSAAPQGDRFVSNLEIPLNGYAAHPMHHH